MFNKTAHISSVIGLFQVNLGNNGPTMLGWNIGHPTCSLVQYATILYSTKVLKKSIPVFKKQYRIFFFS